MTDGLTREAKALLHDAIEKARGSSFYADSRGPRCVIGYVASRFRISVERMDIVWGGADIEHVLSSDNKRLRSAKRLAYLNVPTFMAWYPFEGQPIESISCGMLERLQYLNDTIAWANRDSPRYFKTFMHHVVEMVPTITLYLKENNDAHTGDAEQVG